MFRTQTNAHIQSEGRKANEGEPNQSLSMTEPTTRTCLALFIIFFFLDFSHFDATTSRVRTSVTHFEHSGNHQRTHTQTGQHVRKTISTTSPEPYNELLNVVIFEFPSNNKKSIYMPLQHNTPNDSHFE